MIKGFVKQAVICCVVALLFSCSHANNKPLLIGFSSDSTSIVFQHIDQPGLLQLQSLKDSSSTFNNLVSVVESPSEGDTTFKERAVEGRFELTDSNLVFIPVQPFLKGRDYLVITHLNARFGELKDLLNAGLRPRVKPLQKVLAR